MQPFGHEDYAKGVRVKRLWAICIMTGLASTQLWATPQSTNIFCQKYPKSQGCESQSASCNICHTTAPTLNSYGEDLKDALPGAVDTFLIEALGKVEDLDSDADGVANEDEILGGGAPGDPTIKPSADVKLVYDSTMAFKRMKAIYCGASTSFEELTQLKAAPNADTFIQAELNKCLASPYWKNEALLRLADKKIQPLDAIGFGGNVVVADYRFDYRLFSYIMSDDRDARELLSATYHIDINGNKVEGVLAREEPATIGQRIVIGGGQPLAPERRAGMMTTQWFLAFNTMFSVLPRNTASQVYREYLGYDIAKGEGLMPVANEPRDVDNKNVKQPDCAVCHSTLDPLSYAFSTYVGIETVRAFLFNSNGTYVANRAPWEAQGQIQGQAVTSLLDWADKARNSEAFKKNIARMMFRQALSRDPLPHERQEFDELWQNFDEDAYSVNKLVQRLVRTKAFGGRRS